MWAKDSQALRRYEGRQVNNVRRAASQDSVVVEYLTALDQGKEAAQKRSPPDMFYVRFGATDELHSSGFLITKLGGLSVMAVAGRCKASSSSSCATSSLAGG